MYVSDKTFLPDKEAGVIMSLWLLLMSTETTKA